LGLILYGTVLGLNVWWGVEEVIRWLQISAALGLFIFGNFLSSLSEDILTRAYLFKHWDFPGMIGISSVVYVLNHIHRLDQGLETSV
jgi:membrane protease YdiL (CAAX protease family)